MKVVAAYMMLVLGGNNEPDASQIKSLLSSVGIEAEAKEIDTVISSLKGKNIDEVIAAGNEKLAAVPGGGGGAGAAPADGGAAGGDGGDAPAAAAAEPEEESESDGDMGFSLFD